MHRRWYQLKPAAAAANASIIRQTKISFIRYILIPLCSYSFSFKFSSFMTSLSLSCTLFSSSSPSSSVPFYFSISAALCFHRPQPPLIFLYSNFLIFPISSSSESYCSSLSNLPPSHFPAHSSLTPSSVFPLNRRRIVRIRGMLGASFGGGLWWSLWRRIWGSLRRGMRC